MSGHPDPYTSAEALSRCGAAVHRLIAQMGHWSPTWVARFEARAAGCDKQAERWRQKFIDGTKENA